MKPLTCLLVDDEPLARGQLKALLGKVPGVEIVGEAGRREEAVEMISSLRPQLLFLDVQMRGGGGFEVLAALDEPPAVVFVTAYEQYAIRAFEVNAVDYLLKPVETARLHASLERVRRGAARPTSSLAESDLALLPLGGSGHFVAVCDILYIQAEGHYSRVMLADGKQHLVRQPFRGWLERLPSPMFLQLDRSLIVNRSRISSCTHGVRSAELRLDGMSTPLALGSAAAKRLRELLPVR